jgi:hypothetical protein
MLRVATQEDIQTINSILNHPDVYPGATLGLDVGPLDIGPDFHKVFVLILESGDGCFILDPYDVFTVELHTCLQKTCRGAGSVDIVRRMYRFCFAELAASEVLTRIQTTDKASDLFARQMQFVRISDGDILRNYQLTLDRWPYADDALHQFAPEEFKEILVDSYFKNLAGAVCLMGMKGFLGNACAFYNKHARLNGYPRMDVVGPDSIMVGGLIIHFDEPDRSRVEKLSCQQQP